MATEAAVAEATARAAAMEDSRVATAAVATVANREATSRAAVHSCLGPLRPKHQANRLQVTAEAETGDVARVATRTTKVCNSCYATT